MLAALMAGGLEASARSQTAAPEPSSSTARPRPVFPEETETGVVSLPIVPGAAAFRFRHDRHRQELLVYRPGSTEPDQTLRTDTTEPAMSGSGLSAIDYDGDGDLDLRVVAWWGTGGVGHEVFLYDEARESFERSPLYSGLASAQPDGTGCVTSGGSGGHAGNIYSVGYYCPAGAVLEPRWEERQDWDQARGVYVFWRKEWDLDGRLQRQITEHRRGPSVLWSEERVRSDATGCYAVVVREEQAGASTARRGEPICPDRPPAPR